MKKLSLTMILVLHVLFPISVSADSPTVFSLNQMNQWDLMALSRSLGATTGQLERNLSSRDFRGSFTEFQSRRNRVEALERIQNEAVKFDDTRNFEILEYPIAALSYNFDQNYYDLCVSKSYSVAEVDRNTSIWSPINARVEIVWPQKYMNPRGSLGCSINSSSIGSFRSAWPGSWLNARGRLRAQIDDFEQLKKLGYYQIMVSCLLILNVDTSGLLRDTKPVGFCAMFMR